jgi:hypothetical protein
MGSGTVTKRQWALWSAACVFWLAVLILNIVAHTWLGALVSAGLAGISAYRAYRSRGACSARH